MGVEKLVCPLSARGHFYYMDNLDLYFPRLLLKQCIQSD